MGAVIQKKICMVGTFATGKTSLVQRFVHARFSEKYHSTIGVKVDRKEVDVDGSTVRILLWDVEGKSGAEDVRSSYLKGSSGLFLVADGTRRETFDDLFDLHARATDAAGDIPLVVAFNKVDLEDDWALNDRDCARIEDNGWRLIQTSAKTGDGVDEAFRWLARATVTS